MKKLLLILLLVFGIEVGHLGLKAWRKWYHKHAGQPFSSALVVESKPFVIVIPSYNNIKWCERNIRSALEQDYDNFRVIFIDDCSTDGTGEKVKEIVEKVGDKRVQWIRNEKNEGAMSNFYRAIHSCKNHEIIVILDGDDWLAHEGVLSRLNGFYADPNVWLTYGSYVIYPSYKKGECARKIPRKVVRGHSYRNYRWSSSHLRTFYVGLFKYIQLQDCLLDGKFYESTYDLASMLPMLEMAGNHALFIKDVLYVYNRSNPINDDKVRFDKQQMLDRYIRSLPPYKKLTAFNKE